MKWARTPMMSPTAPASPISPASSNELRRQHFAGNISIEYEYHWENSVPEVAQCIGFVRGYGTAKKW